MSRSPHQERASPAETLRRLPQLALHVDCQAQVDPRLLHVSADHFEGVDSVIGALGPGPGRAREQGEGQGQ